MEKENREELKSLVVEHNREKKGLSHSTHNTSKSSKLNNNNNNLDIEMDETHIKNTPRATLYCKLQ